MGLTSVAPGKIRLTSVCAGKGPSSALCVHSVYPFPPQKEARPRAGVYDFSVEKKKTVKNELSQPLGVNVHSSCFPRKASQCCRLIRMSGILATLTERQAPKCDEGTSLSDSSTRFIPHWKEKAWDYQACPTSRWGVPQENSVTVPGRLGFLAQFFPLANSFLWWRYRQRHGGM